MDLKQNDTTDQGDHLRYYKEVQELGNSYASLGDYHHARKCYEKAATLGPDEPNNLKKVRFLLQ